LFLDEIGEMPLALQVKILRVLQERCITRLGGTSTIPINARIICATNRNLEEDVREGRFREDLFYRLNVVRIQIPPLRERREDIPVLSHFILQKLNTSMGRHFTGFTPRAMEMLKNHSFYGNVRELENILERAAIFADGELITENELDLRGSSLRQPEKEHDYQTSSEPLTLADAEKAAIEKALRRWEGNRTHAAEELGISRRTLITKIQEYNIEI
jgi:two-component system response regulator AtoC